MKTCYVDKDTRSIADLCDYYGQGMLITRINVPKIYRNMGHARKLFTRILHDADVTRTKLFLEISPSDGLNYAELESWYMRHGFKTRDGIIYVRKPLA